MSTFRTTFQIPSFSVSIDHQDQILSLGSCFAEHMAQRLLDVKFPVVQNPFGILYNPLSIDTALRILLEQQVISEDILFNDKGVWHSPFHHSRFSGLDKTAVWNHIKSTLEAAKTHLNTSNRLIITLGTAFVYENIKSQQVVANCHKLPAREFRKRRLSVAEIGAVFIPVFKTLIEKNPDLDIILTVSPVRHIRDGVIENQRSKATLLLAVDEICKQIEAVHYFPAYELVLDDLRDYRFFAADMVHPSLVAIDYVWGKFGEAFFQKHTEELIGRIEKITTASQHRPFYPASDAHQLFIKKQLEKIRQLKQQYPFLDFSKEEEIFCSCG